MMRTVEILLVIIIITSAFIISSLFAVLPSPRQVSPLNLRRLALTTLQTLDVDYALSDTVFRPNNDSSWSKLQIALGTCFPPNIVYNLTVYEMGGSGRQLYIPIKSLSNAESLGMDSDSSSYLVASSNVTFGVAPEKIGEHGGGGTLYLLNCSDSKGWWITGYTAQNLANDLYNLLSPYFKITVMVQNTTQLARILNGTKLSSSPSESVMNAVVINTCGEAIPIPAGYYATQGYYAPRDSYSQYCHILGQKTRLYNWTWVSIVGYPMYYVSNVMVFPNSQNGYGMYGMKQVGPAGLNAFLRGLNQVGYNATWWDGAQWKQAWWNNGGSWQYVHGWITDSLANPVYLSSQTMHYSNYYGIYPSPYQTATRALPTWITTTYNLSVSTYVFNSVNNFMAGAVYRHKEIQGGTLVSKGSLFALGLTRTPDIRLTALGLLCDYKPRIYRSEYTSSGNARFVVLQLGQTGGV